MSKILLTLLVSLIVSPVVLAQPVALTAPPVSPPAIVKQSPPAPLPKSEVILDKIAYDNESEFQKNIPIAKLNTLINSYINAFRLLANSSQANTISLEVTYDKTSQSFNMQTKDTVIDKDLYQKVGAALKATPRPEVTTKLKMFILIHVKPFSVH